MFYDYNEFIYNLNDPNSSNFSLLSYYDANCLDFTVTFNFSDIDDASWESTMEDLKNDSDLKDFDFSKFPRLKTTSCRIVNIPSFGTEQKVDNRYRKLKYSLIAINDSAKEEIIKDRIIDWYVVVPNEDGNGIMGSFTLNMFDSLGTDSLLKQICDAYFPDLSQYNKNRMMYPGYLQFSGSEDFFSISNGELIANYFYITNQNGEMLNRYPIGMYLDTVFHIIDKNWPYSYNRGGVLTSFFTNGHLPTNILKVHDNINNKDLGPDQSELALMGCSISEYISIYSIGGYTTNNFYYTESNIENINEIRIKAEFGDEIEKLEADMDRYNGFVKSNNE